MSCSLLGAAAPRRCGWGSPALPISFPGNRPCGPGPPGAPGATAKYGAAQTDRIIDPLLLPLAVYVAANLAALVLYGADKRRARLRQHRIRERILLLTALAGPFGALAGMRVFRHKTRKIRFVVAVPLFAALHVGVIVILLAAGGPA